MFLFHLKFVLVLSNFIVSNVWVCIHSTETSFFDEWVETSFFTRVSLSTSTTSLRDWSFLSTTIFFHFNKNTQSGDIATDTPLRADFGQLKGGICSDFMCLDQNFLSPKGGICRDIKCVWWGKWRKTPSKQRNLRLKSKKLTWKADIFKKFSKIFTPDQPKGGVSVEDFWRSKNKGGYL